MLTITYKMKACSGFATKCKIVSNLIKSSKLNQILLKFLFSLLNLSFKILHVCINMYECVSWLETMAHFQLQLF